MLVDCKSAKRLRRQFKLDYWVDVRECSLQTSVSVTRCDDWRTVFELNCSGNPNRFSDSTDSENLIVDVLYSNYSL
jgi:hypothetical protein